MDRFEAEFPLMLIQSKILDILVSESSIRHWELCKKENRIEIVLHNKHFSGKKASEVYQEGGRTPKIGIQKTMTWTTLRHNL